MNHENYPRLDEGPKKGRTNLWTLIQILKEEIRCFREELVELDILADKMQKDFPKQIKETEETWCLWRNENVERKNKTK